MTDSLKRRLCGAFYYLMNSNLSVAVEAQDTCQISLIKY